MYNSIKESYLQLGTGNHQDNDYPERCLRIELLTRVLKGQIYNHLKYAFHEEITGNGDYASYVPLRKRRPSVRYNLCKIVVDDSVSLLFGADHFPKIDCANDKTKKTDEKTKELLELLIKETKINKTLIEAATLGSVGSVVVLLKIYENCVYFETKTTQYLTPTFDLKNPDKIIKLREARKLKGDVLQSMGYDNVDENVDYWFVRVWDEMAETLYVPYTVSDGKDKKFVPQVDSSRTVTHGLGFLPAVWIKNLPAGEDVDGACTFEEAIDTNVEMDYQLSQAGRGLKYSSDPKLVIKTDSPIAPTIIDPAKNALMVDTDGDAKLLEINGTAARTVVEYVETLRKFALESIHGNRSDADKISTAQSGKAMELMNQSLIWLTERLRVSYGECGLQVLLMMLIKANAKTSFIVGETLIPQNSLNQNTSIQLLWPEWYAPTSNDKNQLANSLKTFKDSGIISQKTAVKSVASVFDIENTEDEMKQIEIERQKFLKEENPKVSEVKNV